MPFGVFFLKALLASKGGDYGEISIIALGATMNGEGLGVSWEDHGKMKAAHQPFQGNLREAEKKGSDGDRPSEETSLKRDFSWESILSLGRVPSNEVSSLLHLMQRNKTPL